MNNKPYEVTYYHPLQVTSCLGSGLLARFDGAGGEPGHTSPVAAFVVCRVTHDLYLGGKFYRRGKVTREVCGLLTYAEDGFGLCEEMSNFLGYLQPGQE